MAANATNATNGTEAGGGAAPPGGGPPQNIPGLDVAQRQLNRVMEMLREMEVGVGQQVRGGIEGTQNFLRNFGWGWGDQATGMLVDPDAAMHVAETISHAHEVLF